MLTNLLQGSWSAVIQPKTQGEDRVFTPGEGGQNFPHQVRIGFPDEPVKGQCRIRVGHDFRDAARLVVTHRRVQ